MGCSGVTAWSRLREWTKAGVWPRLHVALLNELRRGRPGHDALRTYFGSRPADRLSRRICTDILVTVTSADTAATTYFTTYRVDGYSEGLVPLRPPVQVGHYEDTFRKVDDTWQLATRTLFPSFAGPTERLARPAQS
ncbi:nuclear transport factor 2 family protein [Streptomyces gardneri]